MEMNRQQELKYFQQDAVLLAEKKCLETALSSLRGYYLLLLGGHRQLQDLPSHCLQPIGVSIHEPREHSPFWIQSSYEHLAIKNNSIDAAIVSYNLEYTENPAILLKEIYRCLIGEGKLFLFGFERLHPWCWIQAPKPQQRLSFWKVKKLLEEAGFSIEISQHIHYGAIYFLSAQKHLAPLTPMRLRWKTQPAVKSLLAGADTRNCRNPHGKSTR